MRLIALAGLVVGKLTVLSLAERRGKNTIWRCLCECGNETLVAGGNLRNGHTRSCGCLKWPLKHGHAKGSTKSREYGCWSSMKNRCLNPAQSSYHHYGGRGIQVCERWLKFENFLADMGPRPKGTELERRDNDGDYEPANCYWATHTQQMRNTRKTTMLVYQGEKKSLSEWAEALGLRRGTLKTRLQRGWSLERAMASPLRLNQYSEGLRIKERGIQLGRRKQRQAA